MEATLPTLYRMRIYTSISLAPTAGAAPTLTWNTWLPHTTAQINEKTLKQE